MKRFINIIKFAVITGIAFSSCTDSFEHMNGSPFGVTDNELLQDNNYIGSHFPRMQQSIYYNPSGFGWDYQLFQNLNADIWSGYMASGSDFKTGGIDNETYSLLDGWNSAAWDYPYSSIMPNQLKVTEKCEEAGMETYAHFNAINTVIKVLTMSRVCDDFGPIIYNHYGESMTGGTFDSAQDAYKAFFKDLTNAAKTLYEYSNKQVPSFANFDLAYDGDLSKWAKLANTLRLRLAIRVVKYDKKWAQEEGEAAIKDKAGLLQTGESFTVKGKGWKHPLYICSIDYKNCFISANVQSIMEGYEDPRLEVYGMPSALGKVTGIRTGIPYLPTLVTKYVPKEGKPNISFVNVTPDQAGMIVSAAETYFLLAEAALRGWFTNGKTAKELYEAGIDASFNQWGVSSPNYKTSQNKPIDYKDPLATEFEVDKKKMNTTMFDINAVSKVTPNWDDATTDEERLEKIITQKWIAGFPEGKNAWAEWRRTGYPKLFPIMKNESQGVIPTKLGVRRMPYPMGERGTNKEGVEAAVKLLGGPDNGATRIFWDVDNANF